MPLTQKLKISFIGFGSVAKHLSATLFKSNKVEIVQVYNRSVKSDIKKTSKAFGCHFTTNIQHITPNADMYFICVSDDAIKDVSKQLASLKLKGLVIHISGTVELKAIQTASKNIGVFYPLYSFAHATNIDWEGIPVFTESNSKTSLTVLKQICSILNTKNYSLNSENRLQLHLAAVIANNFTNALFNEAYKIVEQNTSLNPKQILLPIIEQAILNLNTHHPKLLQTGPAKRGDKKTISKHQQLIKHKQLEQVYKAVTKLIEKNNTN